jgi:hypothetical protein
MQMALAALVVGLVEKTGILDKLPTIPVVGRKGTIALAAWYYSKHGGGNMARKVAIVAAVLSGYQLGKEGSVSGEGDDVSGFAVTGDDIDGDDD